MTNLQSGLDDHRTTPQFLMQKALAETQSIAAQKPADSPFALPLKNFQHPSAAADRKRITDDVLNAIDTQVLPSYQRFAKFLAVAYIPNCRTDPGISALPDGDAYYAFRIRQSTTLDKSAAQIHQIGLDEVARDQAEMLTIVHKLGFADQQSFNAALKANPKLHPTSADALLATYKGYIAQMQSRLPQLFGTLPKARLEVVAMPAYMAPNQPQAFYDQGTPDGKRPGQVDINTYHFADRSLADVEAVAYHEGIPGHHLQISIQQEFTGLPAFRQQAYYTAYTEGWALYSANAWARRSASIRTPTPTTVAWRPTCGAPSASWWTPASTPSTGPASRWSTTSTSTPAWTRPTSSPRSTATSRGPRRRSATRWASSKFSNCATAPNPPSAPNSTSRPSTTSSSTPARSPSTSSINRHRRAESHSIIQQLVILA
jgi:hypothetical protein